MNSLYHVKEIENDVFVQKFSVLKDGTLTELSFLGAFKKREEILFRLLVTRKLGVLNGSLAFEEADTAIEKNFALHWKELQGDFDVYEAKVSGSELCGAKPGGLFFYRFVLSCAAGIVTVVKGEGISPCLLTQKEYAPRFQHLIYADDFAPPNWIKGNILYQIFPDRFCRGGEVPQKAGTIINSDWENGIPEFGEKPGDAIPNNTFFGGTLIGIAEKLDYLKELGVGCLYLNPIFEAASNHKYDTGDYKTVDALFGGEDGLIKLIAEAKKREIAIVLDGVFNHTGDDSRYFNKYGKYKGEGAYQSKNSPYYHWYTFKDYPDSYECWWGVDILPAIKKDSESFQSFIAGENGVISSYMQKGIRGWRLDVADELSQTFLEKIRTTAKKQDPQAILIGEVWEDASNKIAYEERRHYFEGNQLDSVMNYPLRDAIIDYMTSGSPERLFMSTRELYSHYPKEVSDCLMNLLGSHDTERILTVLGGEMAEGKCNAALSVMKMTKEQRLKATALLKLAFLLLYTLPGVPCVYYGDEAGMEGYRDPFNRRCFPWGREDKELLEWVQRLGKIRRSEPLFADGVYEPFLCEDRVFGFTRYTQGNRLTVIVNRGEIEVQMPLTCPMIDLISKKSFENKLILPPICGCILKESK